MTRFMKLALILFGAGIALVVYALLFGPNQFSRAAKDQEIPVGEIQYDSPNESPQQPWIDSQKQPEQPASR